SRDSGEGAYPAVALDALVDDSRGRGRRLLRAPDADLDRAPSPRVAGRLPREAPARLPAARRAVVDSRRDPGAELLEKPWIDCVRERVLAVEHIRAGLLERAPRQAAPLHRDHGVGGSVTDRDPGWRGAELELETLDRRDEPAQRDERRRARAAEAKPERVGHHRTLGEPAEDRSLRRDPGFLGQGVEPARDRRVRGEERVRIGVADLANGIPVR